MYVMSEKKLISKKKMQTKNVGAYSMPGKIFKGTTEFSDNSFSFNINVFFFT